jgi:hypothetical protein
MNRSTFAARALIATAALTALGLAVASPASAHTNNMFTVIVDSDSAGGGFATYGKADGLVAPLSDSTFVPMDIGGIEVANEKGTAVGYAEGPVVTTWDHSTGLYGGLTVLAITNPLQDLDFVTGLDTLNDGTTVTLADFLVQEGQVFVDHWAISSVNSATGEVIPLLDFTSAISDEGDIVFDVTSVATDPASGATYVFLRDDEFGQPYFLETVVAGGTFGEPIRFEGDGFEEGQILGADFDADGTLYFNYFDSSGEESERELSTLAAGSQWFDAERHVVSSAPANDDTYAIGGLALTIEHTVLPATGSELPVAAFVALGTVAVVAGGLTVMVARRRSERGTV